MADCLACEGGVDDLIEVFEAAGRQVSPERVNDFATPGVMNLLCKVVGQGLWRSPVAAG